MNNTKKAVEVGRRMDDNFKNKQVLLSEIEIIQEKITGIDREAQSLLEESKKIKLSLEESIELLPKKSRPKLVLVSSNHNEKLIMLVFDKIMKRFGDTTINKVGILLRTEDGSRYSLNIAPTTKFQNQFGLQCLSECCLCNLDNSGWESKEFPKLNLEQLLKKICALENVNTLIARFRNDYNFGYRLEPIRYGDERYLCYLIQKLPSSIRRFFSVYWYDEEITFDC